MAGDRMMRYIVPFYFDGAYEEVCRKLSEASDEWEPGQVACRYVYRHIYQTVNYAKDEKEKQFFKKSAFTYSYYHHHSRNCDSCYFDLYHTQKQSVPRGINS